MSEVLLTYINGNYSYARDEFWGSTKLQMRDIMLEARAHFHGDYEDFNRFIRVIFLP
jgi:hypothetical protein